MARWALIKTIYLSASVPMKRHLCVQNSRAGPVRHSHVCRHTPTQRGAVGPSSEAVMNAKRWADASMNGGQNRSDGSFITAKTLQVSGCYPGGPRNAIAFSTVHQVTDIT